MCLSRLKWQCRRGMRELDMLLNRYLEGTYVATSEIEKRAFRKLLELPDPDLNRYLLGDQKPIDAEIANVVSLIRSDTST